MILIIYYYCFVETKDNNNLLLLKETIIDGYPDEINNDYFGDDENYNCLDIDFNDCKIIKESAEENVSYFREKDIKGNCLLNENHYINDDLEYNNQIQEEDYVPIEFVENIEEDKIHSKLPKIEWPTNEIYFKSRIKPQHADFIIGINNN